MKIDLDVLVALLGSRRHSLKLEARSGNITGLELERLEAAIDEDAELLKFLCDFKKAEEDKK